MTDQTKAKIECNACPVLCQISPGKTGACDRYANANGTLIRVDPVVLLNRSLQNNETPALVPFVDPQKLGTTEQAQAVQAPAEITMKKPVSAGSVPGKKTTVPKHVVQSKPNPELDKDGL